MLETTTLQRRTLRQGSIRWAAQGVLRILYRGWTRVAARVFPEDSPQAQLATRMGIPLPDRLNLSWITPRLAVGGRIMDQDIALLAQQGITAVVDTRSEHKDDEVALHRAGIELLHLPTPDTQPLSVADLHQGAAWVSERLEHDRRVLIHCEHGVGRSVLLTAAVLVAGGLDAHTALELIQQHRWQAAPNHRQIVRLLEFEQAERAREAARSPRA